MIYKIENSNCNYCVDDYNAKAYQDIFSRQVGRITIGVIVASSFMGLAIYKPDVLVTLMDRVVQYAPAVIGEFLRSLDFANAKALGYRKCRY